MEVISIERSTYEELLTSFNSFVAQMKAMASRGNAYSQIERKTYYKPEDVKSIIPLVEKRKRDDILRNRRKADKESPSCGTLKRCQDE